MRALLFSIDILPYRDHVQTSGGSLRSQQFVDRFAANGYEVIKAIPADALLVKTQRHRLDGAEVLFFEVGNQAEIIAETKPDVIVWCWSLIAQVPIRPHPGVVSIVDLNGFQNIESATAGGSDTREVTKALLNRARQADLLIYGSSEQRAYWEGLFRLEYPLDATPEGYVLPFYASANFGRQYTAQPLDFYYVGSFLPWLNPFQKLFLLADELAATECRLRIFASTQPIGLNATTRHDLAKLANHPRVIIEQPLACEPLYAEIGFSGVGFDLLDPSFERRYAYPIRTISYLAHGIPILYNNYSSLSANIATSGAGWTVPTDDDEAVRRSIRAIIAEPPQQLVQRSLAASELAQRLFACDETWSAMFRHLEARRTLTHRARTPAPNRRGLNVLVISNDERNILDLRIVSPLETLLRRDAIGGYAVVGNDGVRRSSLGRDDAIEFDTVVVQRVPRVPSVLVSEWTEGRFIYDIDDNLLASPNYRPPFPPDFNWKVRTFLAQASTVTTTNAFLARSLAALSGSDVAGKAVVIPNPLLRRCQSFDERPIRRVIFASSDELPLSTSAAEVFSSVGAFCRRWDLKFVYVGSHPGNDVFKRYLEGVPIQTLEARPYADYLELVEGLNALAIVPLETGGDGSTVDFVRCKSDIKAVEYLGMGRPAVFSNAAPYRYSSLPITHVVPNESEAWSAGLESAFSQSVEDRRAIAAEVEAQRGAGGPINQIWFDTLQMNQLARPLKLSRVLESLNTSLSRLRFNYLPAEFFDTDFYLSRNEDVRHAVEAGVINSAYDHYVISGQAEGRPGSPFETGTSLVNHLEQAVSTLVGLDGELNGMDNRIWQLKQKFGVA